MQLKQTYNAEIKLLFRLRQLGVVIPADFAVIADSAGIRCFFNGGLARFTYALSAPLLRMSYGVVKYYGED
ncbi:hypothetical protein [Leeuwenhoekiella blandensis]|jgi:hypothetical protein|uniref:Uncharacterized protein n=1 Tax=Leeuwenhoekiella blandensis (strain CECT 7118 / CCUG 51940 / KCTC 22103 / MED217) TaxID=398720 RepID=A3XGI0_LEEBM|nr:hypothetical protein [Leeuwenhoekiella blandensis]EAQ50770.1 hypothetical protein MED217_14545 [Leeuwenhoekiella blandensis MED217]